MLHLSTRLWTLAAAMAVATLPAIAGEIDPQSIESFDIDLELGAAGLLLDDQVISGNSATLVPSGGLPEASDLDAYATSGDTIFFSTDVSLDLHGFLVSPGDVVRFELGGDIRLEISAASLDLRANTDAVTLTGDPEMPLALSFDTTVELPAAAGTILVDDEDLAKTDGKIFEVFFDGSAEGLSSSADLDAAYFDAEANELQISLDISGNLEGIPFDDEDVVALDLAAGTWRLARDGSVEVPALPNGSDLDAYSLEVQSPLIIFIDGFESGDTSAW